MTTFTQQIEQVDQIRRILDAARNHFDEIPTGDAVPISLGIAEYQGTSWLLQYDSSWEGLRVFTGVFRFRSRLYQVDAVVKTEPVRVNVISVRGKTGRTTFAEPVRVAIEGYLQQFVTQWMMQNGPRFEAAREEALRIRAHYTSERMNHALWLCTNEVRDLGAYVAELALDREHRSVFRQLARSNPEADPADLSRIAAKVSRSSR